MNLPGIFNVDPEVEGNMDPVKVSVATPGEYQIDEQHFDLQGGARLPRATTHAPTPIDGSCCAPTRSSPYGSVREFMTRVQQMGFPGLNFMVGEKHREGATRATADYSGREQIDGQRPGRRAGDCRPPRRLRRGADHGDERRAAARGSR